MYSLMKQSKVQMYLVSFRSFFIIKIPETQINTVFYRTTTEQLSQFRKATLFVLNLAAINYKESVAQLAWRQGDAKISKKGFGLRPAARYVQRYCRANVIARLIIHSTNVPVNVIITTPSLELTQLGSGNVFVPSADN